MICFGDTSFDSASPAATNIAVEANNETKWIAPWSVADASKTRWESLSAGLRISDGGGILFGKLGASKDSEELILLYAGTELDSQRFIDHSDHETNTPR